MSWNIDPIQALGALVSLLIVPAAVAYITGGFGVRRALEQVNRQRAFDLRRVQWHESVIRKTATLRHLSTEFRQYVDSRATVDDMRDRLIEVARSIERCASDLHTEILSAVLFADKTTINQLNSAKEGINLLMLTARFVSNSGIGGAKKELSESLTDSEAKIEKFHSALVEEIREQLGLGKLTLEELEELK